MKMPKIEAKCDVHGTIHVCCPKCIGARGGKKTQRLHGDEASQWGKAGAKKRHGAAKP